MYMKTHNAALLMLLGLTGCITQLQEVPVNYAAAPPKEAPPPREKTPETPPVVPEKPAAPLLREDGASLRAAARSVAREKDGKSGESAWTPAPRLNNGHPPDITLEKLPGEKDKKPPAAETAPEPVKEAVVPEAKPAPAKKEPPPPPPGQAVFYIRLGSFTQAHEAEKLALRASHEWEVPVKEELLLMNGKKFYQVHAGPYGSQQQADEAAKRLLQREKVHGEVFFIPVAGNF